MTRFEPTPVPLGSTITVIAPSSPVTEQQIKAGIASLGGRFQVRAPKQVTRQHYFFAGTDDERLAGIAAALADDSKAILCARGGYGSVRLLPKLDVETIRKAGKSLIGFSDATALHALWARAGLQSIHGPVLHTLAKATGETVQSLVDALEGKSPPEAPLAILSRGTAQGALIGGNLTVLTTLVGTQFEPPLDGNILFLEEVGEPAYRVDRMLTHLRQAGWFTRVSGVVLGHFLQPTGDSVPIPTVVAEFFKDCSIPVGAGLRSGHAEPNLSLPLGSHVRVDAERGEVQIIG